MKQVEIYTDGAALGNPGPGGYGVILRYGEHVKEFSGGFRKTTNNRMEILAAIVGLESLKEKCRVIITSDSRYLVDSVTKRWVYRWKANNWKRGTRDQVPNADLWERLLNQLQTHSVEFRWIRGHNGHEENERCDELATTAASQSTLPVDTGYVSSSARNGT
ncbi:MAG: ribonuclease HI [bacterium]